jgi:RNA polymerase sigma-70 factor (ECF subfamily)
MFAERYMPVVRTYLEERWRNTPLQDEVEDAVQDVFIECFREEGALTRVQPDGEKESFRRFLHALVRNVARRVEDRRGRRREKEVGSGVRLAEEAEEEEKLSGIFERAWVHSLLDQAVALQEERARERGEDALRRVELLTLRFREELPIREIARRWDIPAAKVHHEYAQARKEFLRALRDVVAFHHPDDPEAVKRELERLREVVG